MHLDYIYQPLATSIRPDMAAAGATTGATAALAAAATAPAPTAALPPLASAPLALAVMQ